MKKVFLTGGTGFVGSNIAYQLLKRYKVIFLVRQVAGIAPEVRLEVALKVIDPDFDFSKYDYQIINGDICLPNLGISTDDLNSLKADKPDSIFHCAGSISFSNKEYNETWKINVEGTRNVIAFSNAFEISRLHYISTAYVAGTSDGLAAETVEKSSSQHFNNVYEKTKYIADILVSESGLNYTIYRPGIVIGAKTGQTLSFDGYYTYQRSFWILKNLIQGRLQRHSDFYDGTGIKFKGERLILPIKIRCSSDVDVTLNLIPVDWFSKMAVKLSENNLSHKRVFNLTHPCPPLTKWVILTSLDIMNIGGVKLVNLDENTLSKNKKLNDIQQQVDKGIADYTPYTNQNHRFDDFNVKALSNSSYQPPPPIDKAFLERTLNYAIAHNFKR